MLGSIYLKAAGKLCQSWEFFWSKRNDLLHPLWWASWSGSKIKKNTLFKNIFVETSTCLFNVEIDPKDVVKRMNSSHVFSGSTPWWGLLRSIRKPRRVCWDLEGKIDASQGIRWLINKKPGSWLDFIGQGCRFVPKNIFGNKPPQMVPSWI